MNDVDVLIAEVYSMSNIIKIYTTSSSPSIVSGNLTEVQVVGSLLLSSLLVLLYWKMYRVQRSQNVIQQSQADIMDTQSKIMVASFKPDIRIMRIKADRDTITVRVSNQGRGKAKNFRINCQPYISEYGDGYKRAWKTDSVPVQPVVIPLSRVVDSEADDSERFAGTVELNLPESDEPDLVFSEAISRLREDGFSGRAGAELYLIYDSEIGDRFVQRIKCLNDFEINADVTIENAFKTSSNANSIIDKFD